MKILKISAIFFIASIYFNSLAYSQPTLVLNTTSRAPISNSTQTGFADLLVGEALKRIGYKLEVVHMPAERALLNANRGIDDGDLLRVGGLQKKYLNLIQVPEPLLAINMVLFSKIYPDFKITGWNSISSYSLAIISGWKIMENNFEKYKNHIDIIKTDDENQSFTLLLKDRVDFVAYSKWSGLQYLKDNNISNINILNYPLATPNVYIYLHKKHKKIIPLISTELKKMKTDGTIKKIYDKTLNKLLDQ